MVDGMSAPLTGALQRRFDEYPPHIQAAITAYRDALNQRTDWMYAVAVATEAGVSAFLENMQS